MPEQVWQADTLYVCILLDHFPAQCLASFDSGLKKQAFVVVRQDPLSHKSLVWSCSVKARQQKIKSGQVIMEVKKKHKHLQVKKQNREFEAVVLEDLKKILYDELTPDFEVKGNGVLVGDLSHLLINKHLDIKRVAEELKDTIRRRINLEQVAIGVSQSKIIARIMARLARPDGIRICQPLTELSVLKFLDCGVLPGLSFGCREKLKKYGLKKIGQVLQLKRHELIRRLGQEGDKLFGMIRGMDFKLKLEYPEALFQETVFKKDIVSQQVINRFVRHTTDKLCYLLRSKMLLADRLTFLLRYTDNRINQRSARLPVPTNDFYIIARVCGELFFQVYLRRVSIKSIRLIVKKPLIDYEQLKLFETLKEKKNRLFQTGIARIRNRFHFHTVFNAGELILPELKRKKTKHSAPAAGTPGTKSGRGLNLAAGLAERGIHIGIPTPGLNRPRKKENSSDLPAEPPLTFQEIRHTLYGEAHQTDFQKIGSMAQEKTLYSVLVHHKILVPKSLDKSLGKTLIKQLIKAVSPLFEQGKFYSFLLLVPEAVARSLTVLDYLVEVAAVSVSKHFDFHLEFLHRSWFTGYVLETLKKNGIGICNSIHRTAFATTGKGYVRYGPDPESPGDDAHLMFSQVMTLAEKVDQLAIVCSDSAEVDHLCRVLQDIRRRNGENSRKPVNPQARKLGKFDKRR